jgi:hypothetical protein
MEILGILGVGISILFLAVLVVDVLAYPVGEMSFWGRRFTTATLTAASVSV